MKGITLTHGQMVDVLAALDDARSMVADQACRYVQYGAELAGTTIDLGERLDRAMSLLIEANSYHDAGAYARCSKCGRYTTSVFANSDRYEHPCDCGETDYWTGSFERPGPDAQWHKQSVGWRRRGQRREEVSP